jgi:hypothetical protein
VICTHQVFRLKFVMHVSLCRTYEGWKEIDIIHSRLCKKIPGIPRFAANGVAEMSWEDIVGGARYYVLL